MDIPERVSGAAVKSYVFRVVIEDDAIETAVYTSSRYIPDRFLPCLLYTSRCV